MRPYVMHTPTSCGPAALSAVLDRDYEKIVAKWPGGWRGTLSDTPYSHFEVMAKFDTPWQIVGCENIIRGECAPGKTVILIHNHPILKENWVILASITADRVLLYTGEPNLLGVSVVRPMTFDNFRRAYSSGPRWRGAGVQCAYEVGKGRIGVTRWQRLWAWMTRKWC